MYKLNGSGEIRTTHGFEDEDDEVSTPEKFYTINEVRQVKAKKFRTTAVDYSVHINDLEDLDLIREYERTQEIFEQLLTDVMEGMRESDLIRFVLRMDQLDKPISLLFMPVSRLTPERVFFSNRTHCAIQAGVTSKRVSHC
jgi:hypothetical protein